MKKLHAKHIVVGFNFARKATPTVSIIITEILSGDLHCKAYDFNVDKYIVVVRRGIVEGIRKGNLISLNTEDYR